MFGILLRSRRRTASRSLRIRQWGHGERLETRELLAAEPLDPTVGNIVINELHVNPDNERELVEFIELYNRDSRTIDLSGWFFSDGIDFHIPVGTQVDPGGYVVLSENPTQLREKFSKSALGPWQGKLRNEGETIELRRQDGSVADRVTYGLGFPWPTVGDAPGLSMQLVHPDIDNDLGGVWRSAQPTPLAVNSVLVTNPSPRLRQVGHYPEQPNSGQEVAITARATDPDGIAGVKLEYQLVEPGQYIRRKDADYATKWVSVDMRDDGTQGDIRAGDSIYTVILPGTLQVHRRLIRYRFNATDKVGELVTVPFADDPSPNFAYFVYDGVPDWTGSKRPGTVPAVTYPSSVMGMLPTYHLIAVEQDVLRSQYDSKYNLVEFPATVVYDGLVYDHITFRNRGRASTYQVGKNKWKLNFNRGHSLQARDDYGNRYSVDWDKLNILPGTNPWWRNDVSTEGTVLFEPIAFRLYDLAGVPSSRTHYFQFRVIDSAAEASATSQYDGDNWGLYIGIQQPDGRFLDERALPDGNVFNVHGSAAGSSIRHQGSLLPGNKSDLTAFIRDSSRAMTLEWWEQNLNWDSYFGWNAINLAVNNSDLRPSENVNYYHNQENNQWYMLPWDLDLTFEDRAHLNRPDSQWENIQLALGRYPSMKLAYQNRVRELLDLLLDNGDAAKVVQEYVGFLVKEDPTLNVVEANQAQWDYHPRKVKKGIWYKNFTPALMPEQSFAGMARYMQTFLQPGGYGRDRLAAKAANTSIPAKPLISYSGMANYPVNGIKLRSSAFSDPDGDDTFARIEWQISEVNLPGIVGYDKSRPNVYEIEGTRWESGELPTYASEIEVPVSVLEAGRGYRARVRMQDQSGNWSHWSAPLEFLATPGASDAFLALRISEVHYHPADPSPAELAAGFTNSDHFEFVELVNIGTQRIDLKGTKFVTVIENGVESGIDFDFAKGAITWLEPGRRLIVVENQAAFAFRYGKQLPVAGEWTGGRLNNSGEMITLVSVGRQVQQFVYDDVWYPSTDGQGPSLEIVRAANSDLSSWSTAAAWRPSNQIGGTPGYDLSTLVVGDANYDGLFNSSDLVLAFQAGKYEIGIPNSAKWEEGDWNGDGVFTTADLVRAFQAGNYVANGRPPALASLPEGVVTSQLAAASLRPPRRWDSSDVESRVEEPADWLAWRWGLDGGLCRAQMGPVDAETVDALFALGE